VEQSSASSRVWSRVGLLTVALANARCPVHGIIEIYASHIPINVSIFVDTQISA